MRHGVVNKKFRMKTAHRIATFSNMAKSLIELGKIETTLVKAKYLRTFIEPLITLGKRGDLSARRHAIAKLHHKDTVNRLFDVVAIAFKDRNGGYTRILKSGKRRGDNASMAIIEFTDPIIEIAKPSKDSKSQDSKPAIKSTPTGDVKNKVEDVAKDKVEDVVKDKVEDVVKNKVEDDVKDKAEDVVVKEKIEDTKEKVEDIKDNEKV